MVLSPNSDLAARHLKAIKEARLVKGKFALFWMLATGECGTDVCPKTDCPRLLHNQWARVFIAGGKGLHAGIAQSALTVILKWVISGLTSIILILLGTIPSVPGLVCFHVPVASSQNCDTLRMARVWSSRS